MTDFILHSWPKPRTDNGMLLCLHEIPTAEIKVLSSSNQITPLVTLSEGVVSLLPGQTVLLEQHVDKGLFHIITSGHGLAKQGDFFKKYIFTL